MKLNDYMNLLRLALPGVEVIPSEDNGPRPVKPYVTARLDNFSDLGVQRGSLEPVSGEALGERALSAHRTARLQVMIYGPGSEEIADRLQILLFSSALLDAADAFGVAWGATPTRLDVPNLMDGHTYEPRSQVTFETSFTSTQVERVGFIEQVEITGTTAPAVPETPELHFTVEVEDGED